MSAAFDRARFDRQVRYAPLGEVGQARLAEASVLLVGVGALGGVLAQNLTRAGVGRLVLCDRDLVELSNLPRQVLFEDAHAARGEAKVTAALESLERIGGPTRLEGHVTHVDASNLPELAAGCDLVLDGTDNLATRYLLNDLACREGVPWIYGGVVGSGGLVLPVAPGHGACLRCVFPDPPPPGSLPTCDTAGVLPPAVGAIASLQAGAALRLLAAGPDDAFAPKLLQLDVWSGSALALDAPRRDDCPACGPGVGAGRYDFLDAPPGRDPVVLCGRNTVQLAPAGGRPDLAAVAARARDFADEVHDLGAMLRFTVEGAVLTLFPDGRCLVEGTDEPDRARALRDRYVAG